jgi:hypothetical protein
MSPFFIITADRDAAMSLPFIIIAVALFAAAP